MPLRSIETVERVETDDGEYLKATGDLAKEGVYQYPRANRDYPHRELLPSESLEASEEAWERIPIALDHPIDENGVATVFGAGVEDPPVIGELRSPVAEADSKTKLKGESWFDLSHSGEHEGHFDAIGLGGERPNRQCARLFSAVVSTEESLVIRATIPYLRASESKTLRFASILYAARVRTASYLSSGVSAVFTASIRSVFRVSVAIAVFVVVGLLCMVM